MAGRTQGYASLNCPMTYPEYVAIMPSPRTRRKPGTRPTVASTEGRDSIPSEIVSAIMTIVQLARVHIMSDGPNLLMPACLQKVNDLDRVFWLRVILLTTTPKTCICAHVSKDLSVIGNSVTHWTSPSSASANGSWCS